MYRAFNVISSVWDNSQLASTCLAIGQKIQKEHGTTARRSLEALLSEKIIDGKELTDHWFPEIKADVFICHSHNDQDKAIMWAGLLSKAFGLRPFVDSCVWQHADDLLKIIDNKFCYSQERQTYSYEKRNLSTSHVHMMLSIALSTMLDSTECVLFLNTPNSITSSHPMFQTESPWLFYELNTIGVLRERCPRQRKVVESFSAKKAAALLITHPVPLEELAQIGDVEIAEWHEAHKHRPQDHALDLLYEIIPED